MTESAGQTERDQLPLTSNHWGTYRVETDAGRVTALHPFEYDPDPSPIGPGIVDVLDGPTRITGPMVRKGWLVKGHGGDRHKRGADEFVEVSWDVANKLVAGEIDRVRTEFGNEAIFGGSYGWASAGRFHHANGQLHRFLNCAGGYTRSLDTYSFAAGQVIVPHILGSGLRQYLYDGPRWTQIIDNAELIVAFGGIAMKNSQISQGGVGQHIQRPSMDAALGAGIEFVNISPIAHDVIPEAEAQWIPARPGTDVALILGLAHTLIAEDLIDRDGLDRVSVGFDEFEAYVLGESDGVAKTPEWSAAITEVDPETIRALARRMSSSKTMISASWSLTRQDFGEQPFWAVITLATMLGHLHIPGCGFALGLAAVNTVANNHMSLPVAVLPSGENPVDRFIPVARISDLLLNPGGSFTYDGLDQTYPDTKLVYWAGGNPWHHHQDLNRMIEAWQKPDTIIVHEWCWNTNAKYADIVLPFAVTLERDDIVITPSDGFMAVTRAVSAPVGNVKTDHEIFAGIAAELGVEDTFRGGKTQEEWIRWIYDETKARSLARGIDLPTFEQLEAQQWLEVPRPANPVGPFERFASDPEGHPLKTPSGKVEIYSETVAGFGYANCPGHATWMEPSEWLGATDCSYRLHLVSNQPVYKLHSHLDHGSVSRAAKINGREPVSVNPGDAIQRGITDGDLVRVFNDRGACLAAVRTDDRLRPGVAQLATGAWFDPAKPGAVGSLCKHGNPNVLTHDRGTSDMARGPAAHTCMVEIELFEGDPPPVSAFDPPVITLHEPGS